MTLNEAIDLYKAKAKTAEEEGRFDDAADAIQICEWLRQARGSQEATRALTDNVHRINQELKNTKKALKRIQRENDRMMHFRGVIVTLNREIDKLNGIIEGKKTNETINALIAENAELRRQIDEAKDND